MRRRLPVLGLLGLVIPSVAHAEPPADAIVGDLGQHVIGVGYQRVVAPWVSLQIAADYYQPWTQDINFLGVSGEANKGGELKGFVLRGRTFIHPSGDAPSGLWISPFAQTGVGWATLADGTRHTGTVRAVGASVGYTALIKGAFLLGGGLGIQYHAARFREPSAPPSFARFYPQVEIQVGYAF